MSSSNEDRKGRLYNPGALRRAARRAALEQRLRDVASSEDCEIPDPEVQELHEAIREIAVPAIDELERERRARREKPFDPPPLGLGIPKSYQGPKASTLLSLKLSPLEFQPSEDYEIIRYQGKPYRLTPLSAKIVRILHEDHLHGGSGLSVATIKRRTRCAKVWDAFRSRDGRRFWRDLIEKCEKDVLKLRL